MQIADLAAAHAKARSNLEYLKGWDKSSDRVERELFFQAKAEFKALDYAYQRAISKLSPEERYAMDMQASGAPTV